MTLQPNWQKMKIPSSFYDAAQVERPAFHVSDSVAVHPAYQRLKDELFTSIVYSVRFFT